MNTVLLSGTVTSMCFSHENHGVKFFIYILAIKRESGTEDEIRVVVPEKLHNDNFYRNKVIVCGSFRSYNDNRHLILYVYADDICITDTPVDINEIKLEGYVGKQPIYRETPLGRRITDILLAVNRKCGKTDYIPCISWGKSADYCKGLETGSFLLIYGRIQSRTYIKDSILNTAYEVSIIRIGEYNVLTEAVNR